MSEFTAGNLTLLKYKELLEKKDLLAVKQINENWIVFITDETEVNEKVPTDIFDASDKFPILYFYNFEDHGWGYSIVSEGNIVSKFDFSYDFEVNLLIGVIQSKYPEADPYEFFYTNSEVQRLRDEIRSSEYYKGKIEELFQTCHLEKFKLFELDEEKIDQLKEIMNFKYLQTISSHSKLVDDFKEIVNITEMNGIRSDRLE